MKDYVDLRVALHCLSKTNSMSLYKRAVCKDAADAIEALQAEIAKRDKSIAELEAERDAAVKDMTRIATFASECEMCSHRIGKSGCPDRYTIGCNFNWRGVQHDSEKEG